MSIGWMEEALPWNEFVRRVCFERVYSQNEVVCFLFGFQSVRTPSDLIAVIDRCIGAVLVTMTEDDRKSAVGSLLNFFSIWLSGEMARDIDGIHIPDIARMLTNVIKLDSSPVTTTTVSEMKKLLFDGVGKTLAMLPPPAKETSSLIYLRFVQNFSFFSFSRHPSKL